MPTSVCVLLCVPLFTFFPNCCWCVIFVFIPVFLSSYPWFFDFILSMSGRSSSEALKEEKEVPPLNSPSHKGRFLVGPTTDLGFATDYSQSLLYCGQNNEYVLFHFVPSGDSSTSVLSPKGYNIKP